MINTIKKNINKNNQNLKNRKSGIKYKTKKKVRKDTLYYITQKLINKITDEPLEEQDDYFKSEYQAVKRIKKLILQTYPFEELNDMKYSSTIMYDLISLVYNNNHFKDILDRIRLNEELNIHEKREYFQSIKYLIGESYLSKHPQYNDFKNIMDLLDNIEDIWGDMEYDIDMIYFIYNNSDDIELVNDYLNQYRDIMLTSLGKLRRKMQIHKLMIKEKLKKDEKEEEDDDSIIYKYYEVEEKLKDNISIVNEKSIIIDCMGKTTEEIKKEGYLNNLPIDEVLYVDIGIPEIIKR